LEMTFLTSWTRNEARNPEIYPLGFQSFHDHGGSHLYAKTYPDIADPVENNLKHDESPDNYQPLLAGELSHQRPGIRVD
jgi:hypothetical protein